AAAKEMRVRIEKRLNEECRNHPEDNFLIRQKLQLRNAKICTIDSFCIELVRENFDRLGINPDFSIGDEGQMVLFSENALTEIIDKNFDIASEEFKKLTDAISNDFDEQNLRKSIKEIYDFSQNMSFPEEWILDQIEKCNDENAIERYIDMAYDIAAKNLSLALSKMELAFDAIQDISLIVNKYSDNFTQTIGDIKILINYCNKRDFNKLKELLSTFALPDLPKGIKGVNEFPEAVSAKALRAEAKELVVELGNFFYDEYDKVVEQSKIAQKLTGTLLSLALEFTKLYKQKRFDSNLLTFSDTEHLALSLLCEYKDGEVVIKDIAENIINRFDEVLVDEFQDTNNMQDLLFSLIANFEKKLFVVGDLKQSIYGFRGANPKNFSDKKDRYVQYETAKADDLKKIILGSNFRSREGICDFVNFFFDVMMTGEKSSLKYDKDDHLKFAAKFLPNNQCDVEIGFMDNCKASVLEADAKNVAEFIHRYIKEGQVTDKKQKKLRKPRFSDFTLLFKALSTTGAAYAMELQKYGIPVSYDLSGYVKTAEVQLMFSLLKVIDNPTRDIELAATLMSPLFMFSADELAEIRLAKNGGSLISALIAKAEDKDEKCKAFLNKLNKFSNFAATSSISELISYIYDETGVLNIVSVLESGESRRINLLTLSSLAASYDANTSNANITRFIEHVEEIPEKNLRAAGVSAGDNSVKLMTIHKSKGLQFPVCIIAKTDAVFNFSDTRDQLLIDEFFGVSFKQEFDANESKVSPLLRELISASVKDELMAEALRVFYVAATRAEEKLFISVTTKDVVGKFEANAAQLAEADKWQDYAENVTYGSSYANWLITALLLHEDSAPIRAVHGVSGVTYPGPGRVDIRLNT
ncbi:MAG: UvrD-helicase domain-containing protein, partial [Clostridia bacterium]|nr:UvrD-helicase domain-containing protein [Clostridia bacterium]